MADKESNVKYSIKKFDGTDFKIWKLRIQIALRAESCEDAILNGFTVKNEDESANPDKTKQDKKASLVITSALTDSILNSVYEETALGIWRNLSNVVPNRRINVTFLFVRR